MTRPRIKVDFETLYDMVSSGLTQKDMASDLGITIPTLEKIISNIQASHDVIMRYRALQPLQLTALQARVLAAITPEKIEGAELRDLVLCYKILKDKELVMDGKPTDVKGLVSYLVHIERQEMALKSEGGGFDDCEVHDGEFEEGMREITDKIPELF
jgi:transcriptional regulator with XRE-family HTH domain